jgi:hypothetical protein
MQCKVNGVDVTISNILDEQQFENIDLFHIR